MSYKILPKIDNNEVPDWDRRDRKWGDLVEEFMKVPEGKTLPVVFESQNEAKRARNAVRDTVNLRAGKVIISTRVAKNNDKSYTLFLTRVKGE